MLLFCQNAAEYTVNGWVVTYYKNEQILSGPLAAYTVTVQWGLNLVARLLLAFVLKVKKPYKALAVMGVGVTVMYAVLLRMHSAVPALIVLGLFAFSIAGVYPMTIACTGEMMSSASLGFLLSFAGIGGIVFPWLVGIIADAAGLRTGMAVNLIPCAGIIVLPLLMIRHMKSAER
jgi:fucose permease